MLRRILLAVVFFVVMLGDAYAQLEAKNWLFGTWLGLTFEKDSIVTLNNTGIRFGMGVSVISDKEGNLLFSSNGEKIWNKNYDILKNGDSINGSKGSLQSALFIPMPENENLYYVFTVRGFFHPDSNFGFWYQIIDKTKDYGKGVVILKNQFICGNVCERISATMHSDRKSVWIVVHEWENNKFRAYKLSSAGLDTTPVISTVGPVSDDPLGNIFGQIKFSPSGKKLADMVMDNARVTLFDFNNSTGKIFNPIVFDFEVDTFLYRDVAQGIEFSSNERFLYISLSNEERLLQIDISSNNRTEMLNSIVDLYPQGSGISFQGMQLGLDKRIYIANNELVAAKYYLSAIEFPNRKGVACELTTLAERFDHGVGHSLPNFMQSYFFLPEIEIENLCFNDSTAFSLADTANIDSVLWKFGDGDSMVELFPKHVYADTGIYNVEAILFFDNQNDTFSRELRISNYAYANFSIQDTFQCLHGNEFRFYDSSHAIDGSMTYKWDFGDSTFLFSQNPSKSYIQADTFSVTLTVTSSYGCETSVTKNVYVQSLPELDIQINDSVQCLNENSFSFFNKADSFNYIISKKWDFGDGDSSYADTAFHSYDNFDSFRITLIEETIFGCWDTSYKDVVVHPSPKANFSFNDSAQCFNEQMLEAGNSSLVARDSIIENKWVVNSDTVFSKDLTYFAFDSSGVYQVQLIVTTANICRDTLVKDYVVHPSPKADFEFNDATQCFNTQLLDARNSSLVVGDSITENLWYLSQDTLNSEEILGYEFDDFGTYPVKLVVSTSNDCRDSITKSVEVYEAPIAVFSINDSMQCFNEQLLVARNSSLAAPNSIIENKWILNSDTVLSKDLENYTFDKYGNYSIKLIVTTKNDCRDTSTSYFVLHPSPLAKFSLNDSMQCFNEQSLVASNSSLSVGDSITEYQWFLDSQFLTFSSSPVLPIIQPGTSQLTLIATTSSNCPDTAKHSIIIHPSPLANFAINDSTQCLKSNSFDFTNLSTIQSGTMDYQWHTNNQIFQSFNLSTFNYPQWGKYPVSLTATSNQNCKDSLTKHIYIYPNPVSAFVYLNKCLEDTMYFYDSSYVDSGMIAQWYWNFGDTNRSTMKDPTNIYQTPGQYGVILTTTTDQGCTDDRTRFFKIHPHVSPNEIVRATVENDETILLEWLPPDEGKPETYTLEKSEDGMSWFELSTFNKDEFSYEDYSVWVDDRPYWYRMNVTDSCQHTSDYSNIGKSILLKVDNTQLSPQLTWTAYHEWAKGVESYALQIKKDGEFHNLQSFIPIAIGGLTFNFIDSTTKINETEYCYRIVAHQTNSDVVSVSNVVCIPTEFHVYAPNSFTPNGDGTNDIFKAVGTYILDYHLIIYDRWGTKLFETTDITQDWDGTYKNQPCPIDAYYFYISAQGTGSQSESLKGTVMLIR